MSNINIIKHIAYITRTKKMKSNSLILNGQFFIQKTTGQQRYAKEILNELDKIINKNEITVVIPKKAIIPSYKNITIVRFGSLTNRLWEQLCLVFYLWKNNCRALSFCNTTPYLCPGPTVVHDIIVKEHHEYFTTLKGKLVRLYYSLILHKITKSNFPIITVTHFSKEHIHTSCHIPNSRIIVISNAWQHFERIEENIHFFIEHPEIQLGNYYFALGSFAKQKNFEWIYKNAKLYPEKQFVIAGKQVANYKNQSQSSPNILYLGYIPDKDIKALMKHCKAFVFPSLFEGFGIPPLEALSVGASVISSKTSCLPEVLENAVHYIDPTDYFVNLDTLILHPILQPSETVLNKYSWEKSAKQLYQFIKEYREDSK